MTTQFINYNKCNGEKGHIQNNWSFGYSDLKREIEFQIVRSENYIFLEVKWFEFLSKIISGQDRFVKLKVISSAVLSLPFK